VSRKGGCKDDGPPPKGMALEGFYAVTGVQLQGKDFFRIEEKLA